MAIQSILHLKSLKLVLQCVKQTIKGNFSLWAKTRVRTALFVPGESHSARVLQSAESSQSQTVVFRRSERPPWRPETLLVLLTRLGIFRLGQHKFTGLQNTHGPAPPPPLHDGGSAPRQSVGSVVVLAELAGQELVLLLSDLRQLLPGLLQLPLLPEHLLLGGDDLTQQNERRWVRKRKLFWRGSFFLFKTQVSEQCEWERMTGFGWQDYKSESSAEVLTLVRVIRRD